MPNPLATGGGPCGSVCAQNVRVTAPWGGGVGYWAARTRATNTLRVTQGQPCACQGVRHKAVRTATARRNTGLAPVPGRIGKQRYRAVGRAYK
jgi:hypothetical protein